MINLEEGTQDAPVDQLKQLPADVLCIIVCLLSIDSDDKRANASLSALRLCSKGLTTAVNTARLSITLHPSHIQHAFNYLTKLTSLTKVVLRASPCTELSFTTVQTLLPLSIALPHLTSLTLHPGSDLGNLELQDVDQLLLPWQHSLEHLEMHRCFLSELDEDEEEEVSPTEWSPNLPRLTSLVLSNRLRTCSDMWIDLTGCPELRELDMRGNGDLAQLQASGLKQLQKVTCIGSDELVVLDLSGCCKLQHLECSTNDALSSLILSGCASLQSMKCENNELLANLGLADCVALTQLVCIRSNSLSVLDLTLCTSLQKIECTDNALLVGITLPHNSERPSSLESFECTDNNSLAALDVTGCCALRTLTCSKNSAMTSLDVTGCCTLDFIYCTDNPSLLGLDFSGCRALQNVTLRRNQSLARVHLMGCWNLQYLDKRECDRLGDSDVMLFIAVSGCHWLQNEKNQYVFAS